jgi:hypothetical protein
VSKGGNRLNLNREHRGEDDATSIAAIRKRLRATGLPMRAIHVLIRLGFERPSEVRAALLLDRGDPPGLRSQLLHSRNCGRTTIAQIEQWLSEAR